METPAGRPPLFTRDFLIVWACTFLTFFAAFQLFPTAPHRLLALGATRKATGWFLAAFTVGSSGGALVTGPLGDRVGHRRMLTVCTLGLAAIMAAYGLLKVTWAFYALAPLHGAVWSGLITSTVALLGGLLPEGRRAEGMSLYGLASPGGVVFGPTVGFLLFERLGFRSMTFAVAACFLLLAPLALLLPPDRPHPEGRRPAFRWPELPVLALSSILFLVALAYGALSTYSAQEGKVLGLHLGRFPWPSAFFSTMAVGMVLMRLVMGLAGFGQRPTRMLTAMVALTAVGMAGLAFLPGGLARHVASALAFGAGYSMVYTLLNTLLLNTVLPERRGSAFGTFMFAFDAGIGLGSAFVGRLIGEGNFHRGWATCTLFTILAVPLAAWIQRRQAAS